MKRKTPQKEYRIMKSLNVPGHFEVQHRRRWWPFWHYTDTASTLERAHEIAHSHAQYGRLVVELGWLPLQPEKAENGNDD